MNPLTPWFHPPLALFRLTPRLSIPKSQKKAMQVAAKLEDVASLGRIAGQARIAAASHQGRPPYEVMSVIHSNYPYIKNGTDIGASETM